MIINGNNAEIQRNDLLKENAFKIKATGKAFQILSDGLYADKIRAVIRELSCNAFDAHIAAGKKNEPFAVHLPSALEPYFSVRDFGIGLSMDAVMHIFTTYFESLKSDSNDFIGGLGLGSKSPFSYVDAFTVISRWNGIKYSFTAFIGEDDMPKIALLGEEPTDEGNGLEVSMPVRQGDYREFETKAVAVLSRFSPQPTVTGVPNFKFQERKILLEGSNWRLLDQFDRWGGAATTAAAVQGNIAYPLTASALTQLKREYQVVLGYPFEFDFNIGELEIAASREALGYKRNTIANIQKAIDVMYAELPSKFEDRFKNAKTGWEGRLVWFELFQQHSNLSYLLRELTASNKLKFHVGGQDITTNYIDLEWHKYPSLVVTRYGCYSSASKFVAANMSKNAKFSTQATPSIEFFLSDLPKGSIARLRQYVKTAGNQDKTVYFVEGDDKDVKAFLSDLGSPETKVTSTLDKPIRNPANPRVSCRELKPNTWGGFGWNEVDDFDYENETGYYVHHLRGRAVHEEKAIEYFDDIVSLAIKLKLINKTDKIVGVTARLRDKLAETDGDWVDLVKHLTDSFNTQVSATGGLADSLATSRALELFQTNNYYGRRIADAVAKHSSLLDQKSPFLEFITQYRNAAGIKLNDLQNMAEKLNVKLPVTTGGFNFAVEFDTLLKRYPMLSLIQAYSFNDKQAKDMVQYINLLDK
jgi:hypothetical protein